MAGALIAGVALLSLLLWDAGAGWSALPLVTAVGCFGLVLFPTRRAAAVVVLGVLLGGITLWRASEVQDTGGAAAKLAGYHQFEAVVLDVPRSLDNGAEAWVAIRQPQPATVLAFLPPYPTVAQGDLLELTGTVRADTGSANGSRGRSAELYVSRVTITGSEAGLIARLRARAAGAIRQGIAASVPEPAGALVAGVTLGDDSGMTGATREAFRAAGLTHITAVSGWNVSLVAGLLAAIGGWGRIGPRGRLALAIPGIWAYAYIVGFGPSAVRAAIMGTLYLVASWLGRPRDALTALVWATVAMIAVSPSVRFDAGFQLSVAATLGLILAGPYLDYRARWLRAALVPLVAEIAVAPIQLYQFGTYSLVSTLANVLAEPLIAAVMLAGTGVAVASLIHPLLGSAMGLIAWAPARLVVAIAEWSAAIPGVSGRTITLGFTSTVTAYAVLAGICLAIWWRWPPHAAAGLTLSTAEPGESDRDPQLAS